MEAPTRITDLKAHCT